MAVVVFSGIVQLWMLYAFSLGFGLATGTFLFVSPR